MPKTSSNKGTKRKMEDPPSKSSEIFLVGHSLLLLKIPEDINTSFPVWEAIRSKQLDITWTESPYCVNIQLTPMTSKQKETDSTILQPQTITHFVIQQPIPTQNAPHILLTFPQNKNQPPEQISPNPAPSTSYIVPLPVVITQQQPSILPSTHTKQQVQPSILAATAHLTKQQATSEAPDPIPFHTRSSSDVLICDDFLLNLCRVGSKCKMHHTPYPFHWQLCCASQCQWIDFPRHSQVLLERMYSNVYRKGIQIKDGWVRGCQHFWRLNQTFISLFFHLVFPWVKN